MSTLAERLSPFLGDWSGRSTLWLEPKSDGEKSQSTATATAVANGKFLRLDYDWAFRGDRQEGSLLLGHDDEKGCYEAVWIDSWHMGPVMMRCTSDTDAQIDLRGEYEVGDGSPNWGWRITLRAAGDTLTVAMWNISPDGQQVPAVEAVYERR